MCGVDVVQRVAVDVDRADQLEGLAGEPHSPTRSHLVDIDGVVSAEVSVRASRSDEGRPVCSWWAVPERAHDVGHIQKRLPLSPEIRVVRVLHLDPIAVDDPREIRDAQGVCRDVDGVSEASEVVAPAEDRQGCVWAAGDLQQLLRQEVVVDTWRVGKEAGLCDPHPVDRRDRHGGGLGAVPEVEGDDGRQRCGVGDQR